jgi:ABC-type proline/glycine betaine transport system ATPase subunit
MSIFENENKILIKILQMQVEKIDSVINKFQGKSWTQNELMLIGCSGEAKCFLLNMINRLQQQSD